MLQVLFLVTIFIGCQATELSNLVRNDNTEFVQFYLFTKANPQVPVVLNDNTIATISSTPFDEKSRTVIIAHGHKGSWLTTLNPLVKDAFLSIEDEDHNVIVVDWALSAEKSYNDAVQSVANVAQQLTNFITKLADTNCEGSVKCLKPEELHLIGFNLGAHIVGRAARAVVGDIGRITGLDPSGSNWGINTPRLCRTDALYVEVIHTDGNGILANGIGTAIGDVDFFVNGGCSQPGCITHACSHNRAYELFAASLRDELVGRKCSSNFQITMNLCDRRNELAFGNNDLDKLKGDNSRAGTYRINTSLRYP